MREKLVRNTSDERWREYWKAVDAAASNAPKLRYQETKSPSKKREGAAKRAASKSKNGK
jgi:hypothetical protein